MNSLELKVPPLILAPLFAVAMWLAARWLPALALDLSWRHALGGIVAGAGILLVMSAGYSFRKARTTVNPTKPDTSSTVVATGIYRVSRNPMYLGVLFVLAGWALFLSHALPFLFLPAFVAYMNRFQIAPEERALHAKFGVEYESYKINVRRWL